MVFFIFIKKGRTVTAHTLYGVAERPVTLLTDDDKAAHITVSSLVGLAANTTGFVSRMRISHQDFRLL